MQSRFRAIGAPLSLVLATAAWSGAACAQARLVNVQLAEQPMAPALEAVAEQTGTDILFQPDLVAGLRAPALHGQMDARAAVERLLAGTPLVVVRRPSGALVIRRDGANRSAAEGAGGNAPFDDNDDNTIVVTAQRREQTLQDVPIDVQAFDQKRLRKLNVQGFDDYARFAPSVSFVTTGPGQSKLVIRGVAESQDKGGGGQTSAALYLDEQPITVDSANPDPRLIDIERVEVLSGPQGTLYGASSQSGTVRIITNKPDASQYSGFIGSGAAITQHGAPSYDLNAMVNLPLVDDTLAVRAVAYHSREGGYIDNVLGLSPGGTKDNAAFVRDNVNSTDTTGARAALRWNLSSDWKATAGYVFQDVTVHGRSDYDPDVGDLKAVRFLNEDYIDHWSQAALTVEGDLGFADLTLTGAYFDRKISYNNDNTVYDFYLTSLAASDPAYYSFYDFGPDPTGAAVGHGYARNYTAEVRLASHGKSRLGWVIGGFYQKSQNGYSFDSVVNDYQDTPSYQSVADQLPEPTDVYFYQKLRYEQEQYALFGELNYEVFDGLTATVGGRYYDSTNNGYIRSDYPKGIQTEDFPLREHESGFVPKFNLSWKPSRALLVFGTYSEGIRLGGSNRDRPGLAVPLQYDGDKLHNMEIGIKSQWFGDRLTLNLTGYLMRWDNFQVNVRNPDPSTYFYVIANAGNAEIKGIEGELSVNPGGGVTLGASGAIADPRLSEESALLGVAKGTRLPVSPELKFALFGEYRVDAPALGGAVYFRPDFSYTGASYTDLNPDYALRQRPYTIADFQFGLDTEHWNFNIYFNNAFDKRAQLSLRDWFSQRRVTPNQPRTIGFTMQRRF